MTNRIHMVLLALAAVVPAHAEAPKDLTRLFPKDTLIFAGRAGAAVSGSAADDTSFGRMLAEPEFRRLHTSLLSVADQLIRNQMSSEGMPIELYQLGQRVVQTLWDRPGAFGLIDLQLKQGKGIVDGAVVCQVGENAPRLEQDVMTLLKASGAPLQPARFAGHSLMELGTGDESNRVYLGVVGEYFVILCGERSGEVVGLIESGGTSLGDNESLVAARKHMLGNDDTRSMCAFLNAGRFKSRFRDYGRDIDGVDQKKADDVFAIIDNLGFENLAGLCWESHYTNGGCYNATFLHTPGGGKGLLSTRGKPLAESDLQNIPRDATWAAAANLQVADAVRMLLEQGKSFGPEVAGGITAAEGMAANVIGMPIPDFLDLFGDTFIMFDAPENGGLWLTGAVAMVECPDAEKARTHIKQLITNIAQGFENNVKVRVDTVDHADHTIEFINLIGQPVPIAPAWTVHNDWLIVGLYPQVVAGTIDRISEGDLKKSSILSDPDFIRSRKVLGRLGTSMTFVNTRDSVRTLYPFALGLAQTGAAMAQGEGIRIDVSCIPSLRTILKHLHSQVQFTQTFDDGTLSAGFGTLPVGINSLGPTSMALLPMSVGILLPTRYEARGNDGRLACMSNLRAIGQACDLYARNDGKFPTDFRQLVDAGHLTPNLFICPSTPRKAGDPLDACYVLVPGQTHYDDPSNVLVYERPGNHPEGEVNVLFLDGHTETLAAGEFEEKLAATKKRLNIEEK